MTADSQLKRKNCRAEQISKLWYSPKLKNRSVQAQICLNLSSQGCAVVKCFARFRPILCIWNDDLILRILLATPRRFEGHIRSEVTSNLRYLRLWTPLHHPYTSPLSLGAHTLQFIQQICALYQHSFEIWTFWYPHTLPMHSKMQKHMCFRFIIIWEH